MQGQTPANGATPALRAEEALQKLAERLQRLKVRSLPLALLLFLRRTVQTVARLQLYKWRTNTKNCAWLCKRPGDPPLHLGGTQSAQAASFASTRVIAQVSLESGSA